MKIDSHQHFWIYDPVRDSWIDDSMSLLKRDFLPEHLMEHLGDHGIDGCVAVQADQSEAETEFLLELAEQNPFIRGVVGWVDLCDQEVLFRLEQYAKNRLFKGVRHIVQAESDPRFMQRSDFQRGIEALSNFDLTYDILIYPGQLESAIALVEKFPDQPFVLDHMGKPHIKDARMNPWKAQLVELAEAPNVYCKLSGAITEADWNAWDKIDITPYFDVAFEAFGADRLMFGSDWPVCNVAGGYPAASTLLEEYLKVMSSEDQLKIWGGNAVTFYKLNKWTIWKNDATLSMENRGTNKPS